MNDRELRAWVWSFLICYAGGLLAAFGWGRHWNAYLCLLLTLGSVVLWATFVTAWKQRLNTDPLTYERIRDARETLTEAAHKVWHDDFHGAINAVDPDVAFVESKRNLTALVSHLYGEAEWERMLEEDD